MDLNEDEDEDNLDIISELQQDPANLVDIVRLRYRPVSNFGLPHQTKEDIIVHDYFIPKGAVIRANMAGMHMNPDFYPDPDTFKPERFMDETRTMMAAANGKVGNRNHFSFGFGRRICPGIYMTEAELFYTCTKIFAYCVVALPLDASGNEVPYRFFWWTTGWPHINATTTSNEIPTSS
ncbi:cytochrome P450 [Chlamydoabsidia padenii]|nr:cytochrome P450 [Chlamydoabsidia padenii]